MSVPRAPVDDSERSDEPFKPLQDSSAGKVVGEKTALTPSSFNLRRCDIVGEKEIIGQ